MSQTFLKRIFPLIVFTTDGNKIGMKSIEVVASVTHLIIDF